MKKPLVLKILILIITFQANSFASEKFALSSFSTSVADQTNNVKTNIAIASSKINGTKIMPGEKFSFNTIVGEGSAANGFLTGGVLYQDKIVMEPGGGLCQVSSTLFNAFLLAGIKIIERHRHYQPVTYVPLGLDATIKYGKKDFIVKNNYSFAIYIYSEMNEKSLLIKILGDKKILFTYTIDTEEEYLTIPLSDETEKIRPGLSIYVYRKKFKNKKFIENFLLYKDFYPPVYYK